jgi:hypothetical protein
MFTSSQFSSKRPFKMILSYLSSLATTPDSTPDPLEECLGEKASLEMLMAHCTLELTSCQAEEEKIPALLTWQLVAYSSLGSVGLSLLLALMRAIWLVAFATEFPLDR